MKYSCWLNEWLENYIRPLSKERTILKYEWTVRSIILPRLGEMEMGELTGPVIQKFVADLMNSYSSSTVDGFISVLSNSLKCAVKTGAVERHFLDCIKRPVLEEKCVECFTRDEQKKIEAYVIESEKPKLLGIIICLYTGIRIGELFALTWEDVNLKDEILLINKSCHDRWGQNGYEKVIEKPKTRSSKRVIPIPKQILPYLKKLKKLSNDVYVISGRGKSISVRSYQRSFEVMLKNLQIPHRGFHALRHTFATRALECGMDVKTLSEILGHKNPMITLNRYAHSMLNYKSAMMNRVGRLLQ